MTATNTFYCDGVVHAIHEPSELSTGVPLQVVDVDVTDAMSKRQTIVPFSVRLDRRALPDGLSVGDVVRVQFRLGAYSFGPDRRYLGANLRMGNVEIVHRAGEFGAPRETCDDDGIEEFAEHLRQIAQNMRNNHARKGCQE